jgi:hypothetical protein
MHNALGINDNTGIVSQVSMIPHRHDILLKFFEHFSKIETSVADLGCLSQILDPDPTNFGILDPGSRSASDHLLAQI